jgi:probable rRNA maturation factor
VKNLHIFESSKVFDKRKIHLLVNRLTGELNFKISNLEINFISNEEIIRINKIYLNHDFTTDIITFNYSSDIKNIDGEIIISIDDAKINSQKYKVSFYEEIARLVIHGILHLLGYDDQITSKKKVMKRMENKLLSNFKFILL